MEATPPHLPTFNVRLSSATISAIVAFVLPRYTLASFQQLESGKSYNNRIYFLKVRPATPIDDQAQNDGIQDLVLKLSGHYFGPNKVQNEIGALLLLQKYCPTIPVPRILAWSEDGYVIETVDGKTMNTNEENVNHVSQHGWIVMTRLAGRVPSQIDLTGVSGQSVMKQLAGYMAEWRSSLPKISSIGNIRVRSPFDVMNTSATFSSVSDDGNDITSRFVVGGLILCHQYSPDPLFTPLEYYTYLVRDQLFQLQRSPLLASLFAKIGMEVKDFVEKLARLSFLHDKQLGIKFTHLDFSPRNILISNEEPSTATSSKSNLPVLTGLIDFEFAAFLPYEEEFLNMHIRQSDDWTPVQYDILTEELGRHGCEVPHLPGNHQDSVCKKSLAGRCACDSGSFQGLSILVKVVENIAPWFIQDGAYNEAELEKQCNIAAVAVQSGITKLASFMKS